jgi:hypothetical protein
MENQSNFAGAKHMTKEITARKNLLKEAQQELITEASTYTKSLIKSKIKNIERYKILLEKEEQELRDIVSGKKEVTQEDYLFDN